MHVLIATDAWHPQINGVVRSLEHVAAEAIALGAQVDVLTPQSFRTVPLPTYREIRLAIASPRSIARRIEAVGADVIHIATEGPIGVLARRYCLKRGVPFTTSYHTKFPEYVSARLPVPRRITYAWLRRFHNAGQGIMVSTQSVENELASRGFKRILRWSRGVDVKVFHPRETSVLDLPRPIFLYVGRVAVEKNIEAFLKLDLPGSKVVVGDGPVRKSLSEAYPAAKFLGAKVGEDLAQIYASADVFVFPSLTDTFGIVLLEALASGLPIAAYPVTGPLDVVGSHPIGVLDQDLRSAALRALTIDRETCRRHALGYSWRESARQFLDNIRLACNLPLPQAA